MTAKTRTQGQAAGEARKLEMTAIVERFKPVWTRRIQRALLEHLMRQPDGTTDDIRTMVEPHPKMGTSTWDAAVQGLVRARLIRRVGYVTSDRADRHGCPIGRWRLGVEHAAALAWLALHPDLPDPEPGDDAGAPCPAELTPPAPSNLAVGALHQPTSF